MHSGAIWRSVAHFGAVRGITVQRGAVWRDLEQAFARCDLVHFGAVWRIPVHSGVVRRSVA